MITKDTVFILGAGSNAHLKFPTGLDLLNRVLSNLKRKRDAKFRAIYDVFNDMQLDLFREVLLNSAQPSVDSFLEDRPEFIDIGKRAICEVLAPIEDATNLVGLSRNSWYQYILNKIRSSPEEIADNKISFITFNYDRSLDHYLYNSIRISYGMKEKDIKDIMDQIPILHIHGRLQNLPWQGHGGREYGSEVTPEVIKACAGEIKIVHEDSTTDTDVVRARQIIKNAVNVHFLGFGYLESNMKKLGFPEVGRPAMGTAKGYTKNEINNLTQRYKKLSLNKDDIGCDDYVRMFVDFS